MERNPKLSKVGSKSIFGVVATLESAYEHDQISAAKNCLAEWGVTKDEAINELQARGVID